MSPTASLPLLARGLGAGIRNFKGELNAPPSSGPDEPK
jgi:Sec-independent protein translocase protein TatA